MPLVCVPSSCGRSRMHACRRVAISVSCVSAAWLCRRRRRQSAWLRRRLSGRRRRRGGRSARQRRRRSRRRRAREHAGEMHARAAMGHEEQALTRGSLAASLAALLHASCGGFAAHLVVPASLRMGTRRARRVVIGRRALLESRRATRINWRSHSWRGGALLPWGRSARGCCSVHGGPLQTSFGLAPCRPVRTGEHSPDPFPVLGLQAAQWGRGPTRPWGGAVCVPAPGAMPVGPRASRALSSPRPCQSPHGSRHDARRQEGRRRQGEAHRVQH
jgi:hypothetical protein